MHVQVRRRGLGPGEAVAASRLGILGGGFNPPHLGHLILAQEAHRQLQLDSVVLMPYGDPGHRTLEDDPGREARLAMCELVARGDERLVVSRLEVDREGPIYTVDTLRELRARAPDDELFLLLGGDQAASLRSWREPEAVASLARVAIAARDRWRREEICDGLGPLGGLATFFDMPVIEISSTMVRRRARAGEPIRYLMPDRVEAFIAENGLYGASATAGGRPIEEPA